MSKEVEERYGLRTFRVGLLSCLVIVTRSQGKTKRETNSFRGNAVPIHRAAQTEYTVTVIQGHTRGDVQFGAGLKFNNLSSYCRMLTIVSHQGWPLQGWLPHITGGFWNE